jgi:hypothetical protein
MVRKLPALALICLAWDACAQNLTDDQLSAVKDRLAQGAQQSWELGTRAQALTELDSPSFSVLTTNTSLPPPASAPDSFDEVFDIVQAAVSKRPTSATGPQPLFANSAAGDPPSLGVSVLIANWTGRGKQDNLDYAGAARDQLDFLFTSVPHTDDGAISHRIEKLQLWSDFVAMVPPFLSYYGVITGNQSLVEEGYNQIKLYRNYLRDGGAGGLWRHIVMGDDGTDPGHWSTGKHLVKYPPQQYNQKFSLRLTCALQETHGQPSACSECLEPLRARSSLGSCKASNVTWPTGRGKYIAACIHTWCVLLRQLLGKRALIISLLLQRSSGLFGNYADDSSTFDDAASTALLASTVYRLALLKSVHTFVPKAEQSRKALFAAATNGSGLAHFTSDGWLTPVVNPNNVGQEGSQSPEGQAFVVQLSAAYKDWLDAGSPGANAATHLGAGLMRWWVVGLAVLVGTALL